MTRARVKVGMPLVLHGPVPARAGLVSIEFPAVSSDGPPGGRLRFGVAPPAPLSAMAHGEIAISDIVLLRPMPDGSDLPTATDAVLDRMAPSTHVARGARVGLYWETYGIPASDAVEIAVWIERYTPQGILRRFGTALHVATDLNTPVSISWSETGVSGRAHVIPGPVPIIGRSVMLDVSKLPSGDYWLDVVVRRAGHEPVQARRPFVVDVS